MTEPSTLHILVIHGPNMNLVGKRPKEIYGTLTLDKIDKVIRQKSRELGAELKILQSNDEAEIVTKLQRQRNWADGILINPSTLCFTSYTILDTLELIRVPTIEVHMTEKIAGKPVQDSLLTPMCVKQIAGPVQDAYTIGLEELVKAIQPSSSGESQPR
jgi:3-dehydroquinate dehydratase-2